METGFELFHAMKGYPSSMARHGCSASWTPLTADRLTGVPCTKKTRVSFPSPLNMANYVLSSSLLLSTAPTGILDPPCTMLTGCQLNRGVCTRSEASASGKHSLHTQFNAHTTYNGPSSNDVYWRAPFG